MLDQPNGKERLHEPGTGELKCLGDRRNKREIWGGTWSKNYGLEGLRNLNKEAKSGPRKTKAQETP